MSDSRPWYALQCSFKGVHSPCVSWGVSGKHVGLAGEHSWTEAHRRNKKTRTLEDSKPPPSSTRPRQKPAGGGRWSNHRVYSTGQMSAWVQVLHVTSQTQLEFRVHPTYRMPNGVFNVCNDPAEGAHIQKAESMVNWVALYSYNM